jgi:exonuclease SbcD
MKILHTADVHLGRPFTGLGSRGKQLRAAQLDTLRRIVETAASEKVDCVVIAGDLFDSNEVSGTLVRKVVHQFGAIDPVPVFVLPGTHDWLDDTSIYLRPEFKQSPNIYTFGLDGDSFEVDGATFTGYPNDSKQGGIRPLKEVGPDPEADINVAIIHASIVIKGKSSPDDYLASQEDISRSGFTYVALGHWHRRGDYSSGGTTAWYPGAPEPLKFDEGDGAGDVLLVDIGAKKVSVEPRHVGQFTWLEETYDVAKYPPGGPLESELKKVAGAEVLLRGHLRGVAPKGLRIDPVAIEEDLAGEFFHLEVEASRVGYPMNNLERFPSGTVGAVFVQDMKKRIRSARNPEQKALLEEALYRGASYLAGDMEVN